MGDVIGPRWVWDRVTFSAARLRLLTTPFVRICLSGGMLTAGDRRADWYMVANIFP